MNRLTIIQLILLFSLALFSSPAYSEESAPGTSYLLLNNDSVINGQILNFYKGFLYLKQKNQILKISPAHFKGIFSTEQDARKAAILIRRIPSMAEKQSAGIRRTSNIAGIIPVQLMKEIYSAAEKLASAREKVTAMHSELTEQLKSPQAILDNRTFRQLLIIAVLAEKYEFTESVSKTLKTSEIESIIYDLDISTQTLITRKIEIAYYFLRHPYKELQPEETPEFIE